MSARKSKRRPSPPAAPSFADVMLAGGRYEGAHRFAELIRQDVERYVSRVCNRALRALAASERGKHYVYQVRERAVRKLAARAKRPRKGAAR
jgi:hypothetical protein